MAISYANTSDKIDEIGVLSGVLYTLDKGYSTKVLRGKYSGIVLSGNLSIGLVSFTGSIDLFVDKDAVLSANEKTVVIFKKSPSVPLQGKQLVLPPPPETYNDIDRLIAAALRKAGVNSDDSDYNVDDENFEEEDLFDDNDQPLDDYGIILQEDSTGDDQQGDEESQEETNSEEEDAEGRSGNGTDEPTDETTSRIS